MLMTTPFIETLQRGFTARPESSHCEDCPEPEVLWAAVNLELPAEQRREIVRHTAVCASCAASWRSSWELVEARKQTERDRKPNPLPTHPGWFGQNVYNVYKVAAAALVVLAVGVGGWVFHQPPESTFRGQQKELQKTQSLNLDGATLERNDFGLRWVSTPGATYKISVMDEVGDPLVTQPGLESAEFLVSPDDLKTIPSGGTVLWQVEVADPQEGNHLLGPFTTYVAD